MNDHELDRLVATAASVRDSRVRELDLRDAENELMEEIMATPDTSAPPTSALPTTASSPGGGGPRRFTLAVAIGLAAALVVGVVLVRSMGDSDDGDEVQVLEQPPTIAPMIADPLPEGFEVNVVFPEQGLEPEGPPPGGPIDTWVYGDLTATAITNDVVIGTAPRAPEGTVVGEPVTVRGTQGSVCSPGPHQCDFGNNFTGVSWTEPSGVYVTVESRSFERAQLLAIAEGVVVDGDTAELGSVPAGVTKPPKVAELNGDWGWAYTVQYWGPDNRTAWVTTRPETEAMRIYSLWLSGPRDDLEVQGHGAAIEDIDGSYALRWEAAPGQLVEVLANGMDETAARAFAETVRPATDAEWADLQQQFADSLEDEPVGEDPVPANAAHRQLADGATEVWGWRADDGALCYKHDGGSTPSSQVCSREATDVLGVSPSDDGGGLRWDVPAAVGVAPEGTASIDGGEVTLGEQVEGGRLFVWEYAGGEMPTSLTFRDADGTEIATAEVIVI